MVIYLTARIPKMVFVLISESKLGWELLLNLLVCQTITVTLENTMKREEKKLNKKYKEVS